MYCKKCGFALPSHGYICLNCGAMMSKEQIDKQKKFFKEQKNLIDGNIANIKYKKREHENKLLGGLIIILIVIILIIFAILKVM